MSPRRRLPTGLYDRDGRYYLEVRHEKLRGGRMALSMRTGDLELALERRQAVLTLMERGDWPVIDRLRDGELHITDVQAAVRDGRVHELRQGSTERTRLGEAVRQFLQRTEATSESEATYHQYEMACSVLQDALGGDFAMEELTVQEAEQFLHEPKERAVGEVWSPRTQNTRKVIYQALWRLAIHRDAEAAAAAGLEPRLARNPWDDAKVPEIRPTRQVFLRPPEWWVLVEAVRGTPHLGLLTLAYRAGLRSAEIRHLRTDVDLMLEGEEPIVRVQGRKGRWPWTPKTPRSQRDVPLTPDAVELLAEHVRHGFAGARYFVHPETGDHPMSGSSAERWTRAAYERAGIQYGRHGDALTLHSGRHTYASWMAQEGVPLNIVADLLGNTLEEADRTYSHLVPDTYRASAMVGYRKVMEAKP